MDQYIEHESVLLNESKQTKRASDAADNDATNNTNNENKTTKSKKKRRSSLAYSRRSITDGILQAYESSDLQSSPSSSASSQNDNQNRALKPNPLNIRMDEMIKTFEENITRLNQECTQWKMSLRKLEKEEEQANLLSESNVHISSEDIPQELRDLAREEYMPNSIDFNALTSTVENGLLKSYFHVHKCFQDMKLFKGTINTIKCYNKHAKDSISGQTASKDDDFDDDVTDDFDDTVEGSPTGGPVLPDFKSQLEWMMNN